MVSDFSPLRVGKLWKEQVCAKLPEDVPLYEVDTHNIVPVWIASDKQEVGARTIRKKITEKLPTWLTDMPPLEALPTDAFDAAASKSALCHSSASLLDACGAPTDWKAVDAALTIDRTVPEVDWLEPGYKAGMAMLDKFCQTRLKLFADRRNDPNVAALSDLSPYLHFGQISPQRAAYYVKGFNKSQSSGVASFLEEQVVRRELSDNFCFYNPNYDRLEGAANWARESLELHASDKRDHIYSLDQLEEARSHEDIWNAAQRQMVKTGKMHGFFRMYWAKKILEWSPTPEEALRRAIYLNDRYSLDGRDPNGYVGCGWAIMGVHDMGWAERPIFGKIRFMNYAGCKRKFDIKAYVAKWGSGPIKKGSLVAGGGGGGGSAAASSSGSGKAAAAAAASSSSSSSGGKKRGLEVASAPSTSIAMMGEATMAKHKAVLQDTKAATADVLGSLRELSTVSCPRAVLESTKIGVAVGLLRKHADAEVAALAEEVVAKWKAELKPSKKAKK